MNDVYRVGSAKRILLFKLIWTEHMNEYRFPVGITDLGHSFQLLLYTILMANLERWLATVFLGQQRRVNGRELQGGFGIGHLTARRLKRRDDEVLANTRILGTRETAVYWNRNLLELRHYCESIENARFGCEW